MQVTGFISKAACRGYRPSKFASHRGRQRPHLIARLARERGIARFIVAPDGYGKTCLAVDYAETMFSWTHVFWLNAKSPCFLRDLDNGELGGACLELDPDAKLVVIDDLPQLDAQRVQMLSCEIDLLIARGCEVIVACNPASDLFAGQQADRLRVGALDLLLTDEEVDAMRTEEERLRLDAAYVPPARRVPALVWDAQPATSAAFVAGNLGEGLPADMLLAVAGAFALQRGFISDLTSTGPVDVPSIVDVFSDYPHLGFDVEAGRFEAPHIDAEPLMRAIKPRIDAITERSRFDSRDELVQAWASALIGDSATAGRACDLVRLACSVKQRTKWLIDQARSLVRCGSFQPAMDIISGLPKGRYEGRERVYAFAALCLRMLGDREGALRYAKRFAFDAAAPRDAQAVSLMVLARFAPGELRLKALTSLSEWASALAERSYASLAWHEALVVAWAARGDGVEALGPVWTRLLDAGVDDDVLCVAASWLFALAGVVREQDAPLDIESLERAERYIRARFSADDGKGDFFVASAGLSMEEAHSKGIVYRGGPLEAAFLLELRHVEMNMLMQRRAYEQGRREERSRRASWQADGLLYGERREALAPVEQKAVPLLEVRTFGRLELSIGGTPLEMNSKFGKKARLLLALLVANRGRDVARDVAAQAMWPTFGLESARKSFYSAWSSLRRMLSLPDGTCPYLVRHQYGCRLEGRYVRSDVDRHDDICRELLFGRVDFESWRELYNEIDGDFLGEFMPAEENSELVLKLRDDLKTRLVDALVTASTRLVDARNPQWAIWYARSAVDREGAREDAYVALMRAQIACDQRTAAMMTYLKGRRALADELGIDPSPEMQALYEGLLGS